MQAPVDAAFAVDAFPLGGFVPRERRVEAAGLPREDVGRAPADQRRTIQAFHGGVGEDDLAGLLVDDVDAADGGGDEPGDVG